MGLLFKLAFIGAFLYGYIANIVTVWHGYGNAISDITIGMAIRIAGIFIPFVGAVAGYI